MSDFNEDDLQELIDSAVARVAISPPLDTVSMVVAFMVATDAIGPNAARYVTLSEFFELFGLIFKLLSKEDE